MRFPNAAKGVKMIYRAEIFKLLGVLSLICAGILFVISYISGVISEDAKLSSFTTGNIGAIILCGVFIVFLIIAFFMHFIGINTARNDEKTFKTALFFLIIGIVLSVAGGCLANNSVSSVLYSLSTMTGTISTIYVIAACVKLADRMNRGDVSAKGSKVFKLIIAIELLSFVIGIVSTFTGSIIRSLVTAILLVTVLVLEIVKYVTYLVFLAKAKKMLLLNR